MNSRILFLTAMLLMAGIELMAQNNRLAGIWRVQVNRSIDLMNPTNRAKFDTLSSETKDRAVKAMTDREFVFSADGNVTVNWTSGSGPRVSTGTWVLENGELLITVKERTTRFSYELPSETTLIVRGKQQRGFFDALYLEKIN